MKAYDFRDKFLLLLSVHSDWQYNGEINYPQWAALKKGIYQLLAEAGSESRCSHPQPLYDNILCITCGRKPDARNTLSVPPEAA